MNLFDAGKQRLDAEVERRLNVMESKCCDVPSPVIVNFFNRRYGMDEAQIYLLWDIAKVCCRANMMKDPNVFVHDFVDNTRDDFVVLISEYVRCTNSFGQDSFMCGNPSSMNLTDQHRRSLLEMFDDRNKITEAIVIALFSFLCDTSFPQMTDNDRDLFWGLISNAFTSRKEIEEYKAMYRIQIRNQILYEEC